MSFLHVWLLSVVTMATTYTAVQGACQKNVNFTSVAALVDNINACAYPTSTLNVQCVSDSCPLHLYEDFECPWNSAGALDPGALPSTLTNIGSCIQLAGNLVNSGRKVCTQPWRPIPIPVTGLLLSVGGYALQCTLDSAGKINFEAPTSVALTSASTDPFNLLLRNAVVLSGVARCVFQQETPGGSPTPARRYAATYACNYTTGADVTLQPPAVSVTSATKQCQLEVSQLSYVYKDESGIAGEDGVNASSTVVKKLDPQEDYVARLFQDVADQANGQMGLATYMATYVAMELQWLYNYCLSQA